MSAITLENVSTAYNDIQASITNQCLKYSYNALTLNWSQTRQLHISQLQHPWCSKTHANMSLGAKWYPSQESEKNEDRTKITETCPKSTLKNINPHVHRAPPLTLSLSLSLMNTHSTLQCVS